MKNELKPEEAIEEAINDVRKAIFENIEANRLLVDITKRKQNARYALLKAKERLSSLESELMQ